MSFQVALLAALTLVVGWLMMFAGVSKSVLEWRRNRRTCPACGREIVARTCPCSSA
jgi:NADH pyrophosphatase NudC (nudix superfamily)